MAVEPSWIALIAYSTYIGESMGHQREREGERERISSGGGGGAGSSSRRNEII
jgi:hypothetical protein